MITKLLGCAVIAAISVGVESRAPAPKVCKTKECHRLAKRFAASIDTTVDPCENFYNYACGKWVAEKSIPADYSTWDPFSIVLRNINSRLKDLLEAESESGDLLPIKQAKKWYQLCMNERVTEKRGIQPIQSIISEIGGWPMAMNEADWEEGKFTWKMVNNFYARKTGNYFFWNIEGRYKPDNEEHGKIDLDEPKFPFMYEFPRTYVSTDSDIWQNYRSLISDVVETFAKKNNVTIEDERLKEETDELIEFENKIISFTQEKTTRESSMAEFLQLGTGNPSTYINHAELIQDLFNTVNIAVDPDTTVDTNNIDYVANLDGLLSRTPARVIVNYLHWRFVEKMLIYTSEEMVDILLKRVWNKQLGIKMKPLRSTKCVDKIPMKHALSYLFVNKYFTQTKEETVKKMLDNILLALLAKIDGTKWMDEISRTISKEKLRSMNIFLAFPKWYNNETAFIEFHKGIDIEDEYFETVLNSMRYKNRQSLRKYLMHAPPFDPLENLTPISANPHYFTETNSAVFPEADFEIPFFSRHYPSAVNYGVGAAVVGHELSHGFDDCGICHAKHGNMTSLANTTLQAYYRRADCFVKQFNKYHGHEDVETRWACGAMHGNNDTAEDTEKLTDGQVTSPENIADTTGLQAVYLAYKKISEEKFPQGEERLPGLKNLSDDQLFFISFSGLWCQAMTPEERELSGMFNSRHSSAEHRIIGAVSNTVGFATAFNCSENSSMNPKNKCAIWDQPKPKRFKNAYDRKRG